MLELDFDLSEKLQAISLVVLIHDPVTVLKFMEDLTSAVDNKNWTDVVYLVFF